MTRVLSAANTSSALMNIFHSKNLRFKILICKILIFLPIYSTIIWIVANSYQLEISNFLGQLVRFSINLIQMKYRNFNIINYILKLIYGFITSYCFHLRFYLSLPLEIPTFGDIIKYICSGIFWYLLISCSIFYTLLCLCLIFNKFVHYNVGFFFTLLAHSCTLLVVKYKDFIPSFSSTIQLCIILIVFYLLYM